MSQLSSVPASSPSNHPASSPSSQQSPDLTPLILQTINKIGKLHEYVSVAENAIQKAEPEDPNCRTNSKGGVCCFKSLPTEHNSPRVDLRPKNLESPNESNSPSVHLLPKDRELHKESDFPPKDLELPEELQKVEKDLKCMMRALSKLKKMDVKVTSEKILQQHLEQHRGLLDKMDVLINQMEKFLTLMKSSTRPDGKDNDISDLSKEILEVMMKLRQHIASLLRASTSHNNDSQESGTTIKFETHFFLGEKQQRDMKEIWESSAFTDFYKDYEGVFKNLERKTKQCLLCFSALPEDAVVKRRALLHWWIGEGFIESPVKANGILQNLVSTGFIQPELKKRRLVGFKMDRLVRPVVVKIAEELRFLSFDPMGTPAEDFSWSRKLFLVEREKESSRQKLMSMERERKLLETLHKLQTIFNVNDHYPDLKKLWFSKLKNLNVLCLGGWHGSGRPHIEVEGTEFLTDLKIMKYLKLLSLQGISRITELPNSLCELNSLLILDLKACHNLEVLPKNLKALKNLTHLDISECYLLDHIPAGLSSLKRLQVFKGFVAGDSASKNLNRLEELTQLKKLRKLSVNTARGDFPTTEEASVLKRLAFLENLTLTWRGKPSKADSSDAKATGMGGKRKGKDQGTSAVQPPESAQQPRTKLQKLELQCFPGAEPPKWLTDGKLKPEKKLYIIGGNLQNLCNVEDKVNEWPVKILRLKFLKGLKMDWSELKNSFKELVYLETVECPKLTLFPCDEDGLWLNLPKDKKLEELKLGLTWSFLGRRTDNPKRTLKEEKRTEEKPRERNGK